MKARTAFIAALSASLALAFSSPSIAKNPMKEYYKQEKRHYKAYDKYERKSYKEWRKHGRSYGYGGYYR